MGFTTLLLRPRDFSDGRISGVAAYVHPERMGVRQNWSRVFVDKPLEIDLSGSEPFEVDLEAHHTYRLEVLWPDPDRTRVGQSWWSSPFRVPESGEDEPMRLADLLDIPARNGMVRVLQSDPSGSVLDQYVYNEATGDLFERRAS